MNLDLLTSNDGPKPWLNIYANSINVEDLNINDNLVVSGSIVSRTTESAGSIFVSTNLTATNFSPNEGGGYTSYNPSQDKIITSGTQGYDPMLTTDGITWGDQAAPIANPRIEWSEDLNLYTMTNTGGNEVYTSPTALAGSWVAGTASPANFVGDTTLRWFPQLGVFVTGSGSAGATVLRSENGTSYTPCVANRHAGTFAFSNPLGILVSVGPAGPMYSEDGITFVDSPSTAPMSGVCWSDTFSMFYAVSRDVPRTQIYYSTDGINWGSTVAFPSAPILNCITWIESLGIFVAGGNGYAFYISSDGLSWKHVYKFGADNIYSVNYVEEWGMLFGGTNTTLIFATPRRLLPS